MSRMKIVHICDKFGMKGSTTHGVSRLFSWWMPRYNQDRYDVKLYALKTPDHASRALEADGVEMTYMGESFLSPTALSSFIKVFRNEHADVVQLHGWIAANYGRLAGRITGIPTIMHEHGVDPHFPLSQKMADRLLSECTHTALAVSRSVHDFLIAHRSVPEKKIRVIYNGAPLREFAPVPAGDVAGARAELGIPENRHVIGAVGRLDTQKGLTYLLKAMRQVLQIVPDAHLLIVGDGPKMDELKVESDSLGIAPSVTFAGHRSDVRVLQSFFDLQAFPSLWEGTPLTVFEAMAMGLPIVSTDVDGLGEVLADGKSAMVVKPSNVEQLARGILMLLSDRELAQRLGDGAKTSSRDFDIDQTVRNMESLYEELCTNR